MATQSQSWYQLSETKNNACNPPVLLQELKDAGVANAQDVSLQGTTITVFVTGNISDAIQAIIDTTVKTVHEGLPYSNTTQDSNDPTEHAVAAGGDWETFGTFSSGPLPPMKYVTQWSAEAKVDTEAIGNRIELRLLMWGVAEASNDALSLPAWQQYQAGAWLTLKAGQSFVYQMQARATGSPGTVRRIRFGMMPASS